MMKTLLLADASLHGRCQHMTQAMATSGNGHLVVVCSMVWPDVRGFAAKPSQHKAASVTTTAAMVCCIVWPDVSVFAGWLSHHRCRARWRQTACRPQAAHFGAQICCAWLPTVPAARPLFSSCWPRVPHDCSICACRHMLVRRFGLDQDLLMQTHPVNKELQQSLRDCWSSGSLPSWIPGQFQSYQQAPTNEQDPPVPTSDLHLHIKPELRHQEVKSSVQTTAGAWT